LDIYDAFIGDYMCDSCGCSQPDDAVTFSKPGGGVDVGHAHGDGSTGRVLQVEEDVLTKNAGIAEHNRDFLEDRNIFTLNLVSSPGSGKTTILERTIRELHGVVPVAVIEGDQQTQLDAERIDATGAPVIQVNTGAGCHLDADMVHRAMHQLDLRDDSILFIENVGNLVCPAMFDLGEAAKVVIISVTEGDDKPLKYPAMFDAAAVCVINKIDLLPHVDFDLDRCKEYARQVNHRLEFFEISAKTGEGVSSWLYWLQQQV
jgi:hydrogenase nickel incorporation protein HypB